MQDVLGWGVRWVLRTNDAAKADYAFNYGEELVTSPDVRATFTANALEALPEGDTLTIPAVGEPVKERDSTSQTFSTTQAPPTTTQPEASPFKLGPWPNATCSGDAFTDGGIPCIAPWVYCTDARCDSNTKVKDGVLVAECLCWMPNNTNFSIIPKSTSGAACVGKALNPVSDLFKVTGGEEMCEQMNKGALISTYGPTGKKPPARALECSPRTEWAWCWGAPCHNKVEEDGTVLTICDCPIMISDYDTEQYVSVSKDTCSDEEARNKDACSLIHNGSPAGGSPMKRMPQCNYTVEDEDESTDDLSTFPSHKDYIYTRVMDAWVYPIVVYWGWHGSPDMQWPPALNE